MMYKSFKHQKTSLSTYTLPPKLNTRTQTRVSLIYHLVRRSCSHLLCSLSLSTSSGLSDLARSLTRSVRISPDQ
ncbi:hypothetical protein Hanom_Chr10g00894131 [Helianthus anomalus]